MSPDESVSPDKRADILQAAFKHYYEMAMDHHTKAGTTSNILLLIVGAIVGLVSHDGRVSGVADLFGGLGVSVVGLFGAAWAWKQAERYHYWQYVALQYEKALTSIVPPLQPREAFTPPRKTPPRRGSGRFSPRPYGTAISGCRCTA